MLHLKLSLAIVFQALFLYATTLAQITNDSAFLLARQKPLTQAFNNKDAQGIVSFFTPDSLQSEYALGPSGLNWNRTTSLQFYQRMFSQSGPPMTVTTSNVTGNRVFSVWEFKAGSGNSSLFFASIQNWELRNGGNPNNISDWKIHVARSYADPLNGLGID